MVKTGTHSEVSPSDISKPLTASTTREAAMHLLRFNEAAMHLLLFNEAVICKADH